MATCLVIGCSVSGCQSPPEEANPKPRLIVQNRGEVPEGARISQGKAIEIALAAARKYDLGTAPANGNPGHATFIKDQSGSQWHVSFTYRPEVDWIIIVDALDGSIVKIFDLRK